MSQLTIEITKTGNEYRIKHYPEDSELAIILNKQSENMVFTEEGADKIKESLEKRYNHNIKESKELLE